MARMVIKNKGKNVQAYELGTGSEMEQQLIESGKIIRHANGSYELFSQESQSGSGQMANPGDYFKVDDAGFPYPNGRDWFKQNHRHISGDTYEQLPQPLEAWNACDPLTAAVNHLIATGKLTLNFVDRSKFFNAHLWGADLSQNDEATLIFYGVTSDANGEVVDANFNFVAKDEFKRTYTVLQTA